MLEWRETEDFERRAKGIGVDCIFELQIDAKVVVWPRERGERMDLGLGMKETGST